MAINKSEDGNYTILTTYQCNWNCSYCVIDTHKKQASIPISTEDLFKKIEQIEAGSVVCLTGGELGLLENDVVERMFETLEEKKCAIDVFTNGLFIKKYPQYLEKVEVVHYHCVEDVDQDIEFPDLDPKKVIYLLVMTNENIEKIQSFIEKYPHIKFKLTCNHKSGEELSRGKAFKILMHNRERIHPDSFKTVYDYSCSCNPE